MLKRFYKWFRTPPVTETMLEVTKDYFSEDDEYINAKNGWQMLPEEYIEVMIEEKKDGNN
jgi:hypothetical protein